MKKKNDFIIYTGIWIIAILVLFFSLLQSIGDARIINFSGIVRGGTQQLIKEELHGRPNDPLIARLDGILHELRTGEGPNHINLSTSPVYLEKVEQMEVKWEAIKEEIMAVRQGKEKETLFLLSEAYFDLTDDMVLSAERHADEKLKKTIVFLVVYLLLMVAAFVFWNRRKQRELEEISYKDALTGIGNRMAFEAEATQMLALHPTEACVILEFDVDEFKFINDTYGYQFGDELLKAIASALRGSLSGKGVFARIGADHFVVLALQSEALIPDLQAALFAAVNKQMSLDLSESISFATGAYIIENKKKMIQAMLDKANMAHKNAKQEGRGAVVWYDEALLQKLQKEHQLKNRMYKALTSGEYQLFLQPKFEIETLAIIGAEALVRWKIPNQSKLSPDDFIPLFEKNGFIVQLDFYMLEKVCAFIKEMFCDNGLTGYSISVNFSRVTLYHKDFYERFIQTVKRFHIPFHYIEIEITESAFNGITESIIMVLERLRNAGFLISMDDFGAGYSSLNLLNTLPIDILKLDKEFLKECTRTQKAKGVITCVVELAHALNMQVICEGIEAVEHVLFLKSIQCDFGQGYYFSKPLQQDEFVAKYGLQTVCEKL